MNLLKSFFGNKVKIVTATTLRAYCGFERQFVFHYKESDESIRTCLWNHGSRYSVKRTEIKRSKIIVTPACGKYRSLSNDKLIRYYD